MKSEWVLHPFAASIKMQHVPIFLREQLIDVTEDGNLQASFEETLHNWWTELKINVTI